MRMLFAYLVNVGSMVDTSCTQNKVRSSAT
jgi:hypothetical protein